MLHQAFPPILGPAMNNAGSFFKIPRHFHNHRTLAEVDETRELDALWRCHLAAAAAFSDAQRARLNALMRKASANNPRPGEPPRGAPPP